MKHIKKQLINIYKKNKKLPYVEILHKTIVIHAKTKTTSKPKKSKSKTKKN